MLLTGEVGRPFMPVGTAIIFLVVGAIVAVSVPVGVMVVRRTPPEHLAHRIAMAIYAQRNNGWSRWIDLAGVEIAGIVFFVAGVVSLLQHL